MAPEKTSLVWNLLWEAFTGLDRYLLLSADEDVEGKQLDPDFLGLATLELEEGNPVIRLVWVRAFDRQVLGQGSQPFYEDPVALRRSVVNLVDQVERSAFIPEFSTKGILEPTAGFMAPPPGDPSGPFYSTWWFWTAVGAVSVLGTLAYIKKTPEGVPVP